MHDCEKAKDLKPLYERYETCNWNTNFRITFAQFMFPREIFHWEEQEVVFYLLSNRNFRKCFANGIQPLPHCHHQPFYLVRNDEFMTSVFILGNVL